MKATAPLEYTPEYCEAVRRGCQLRIDSLTEKVNDIHTILVGVDGDNGIKEKVDRSISYRSLKWWLGLLLVPTIIAGLTIYGFYITAPLSYANKAAVLENQERILLIEKDLKNMTDDIAALPNAEKIRSIIGESLRDHGLTKSLNKSLEGDKK
jgi:hypothetical protein